MARWWTVPRLYAASARTSTSWPALTPTAGEVGMRNMEGETMPQDARAILGRASVSAPPATLRLPIPATTFIGRERAIADICRLLERDAVRLLTLVGPGGIGKTRLALAVAEALQSEFPDGVYFVSLASLTDPNLVLPAIAQTLGVREGGAPGGQSSLLERIQARIGRRTLLLV